MTGYIQLRAWRYYYILWSFWIVVCQKFFIVLFFSSPTRLSNGDIINLITEFLTNVTIIFTMVVHDFEIITLRAVSFHLKYLLLIFFRLITDQTLKFTFKSALNNIDSYIIFRALELLNSVL